MRTRRRGRAFALKELVAVIATGVVMLSLMSVSMAESRRAGGLEQSLGQLGRYGQATGFFAADNNDELWGFSWKGGTVEMMMDLDGNIVPTELPDEDIRASAYQAVHLIRSLDDRVGANGMPIPSNWIANVQYSHLALVEYLGASPLADWTADPGDRVRLAWKNDPVNKFDEGYWLPYQPAPTPVHRKFPYSSSYRTVPAAWDVNQSNLRRGEGVRIEQSGWSNTYQIPQGHEFGGLTLADVSFPSMKVHVFDQEQRHFGPCRPHFAVPDAMIPVASFDAGAFVLATSEANLGWSPNQQTHACDTYYALPGYQPPACSDQPVPVRAIYDWTRGGLKGIDVGDDPIDTGQKGDCPI